MEFNLLLHPAPILLLLHNLFVVAIAVRVIMKRPATGVAMAWLLLIVSIPFVGCVTYLLIGERRIGRKRTEKLSKLSSDYRVLSEEAIRVGMTDIDWSRHQPVAAGLNRLGAAVVGSTTVTGCRFELERDTPDILRRVADDIKAARHSVLMEFYIWQAGGLADEVLDAVIEAAQRGVECRLLIDAIGARPWWKSDQPKRLRAAGVQLRQALPVGVFRTFVGRTDLRLHRKIVVVDGQVAWTGSMNLVDPRFFKQDSGVGEWVDAMVRVTGSVVVPLAITMISDWVLESDEDPAEIFRGVGPELAKPDGPTDIQVIPTGPGESSDGLLQMILYLVNSANHLLVMTTPYLVPDDALLRALRGAAGRGVEVKLIVPERVDSLLTRYASRSYFDDLLEVGVQIYLYQKGLLHTKSIMVDEHVAMFGTANLDMRSLWLNYEVSLFVYDDLFAQELLRLQSSYIEDSRQLEPSAWAKRGGREQLLENTLRLASPLL